MAVLCAGLLVTTDFCVVLQCVLQPIVVCWCELVLKNVFKFKDFWCPSKYFLQWEACYDLHACLISWNMSIITFVMCHTVVWDSHRCAIKVVFICHIVSLVKNLSSLQQLWLAWNFAQWYLSVSHVSYSIFGVISSGSSKCGPRKELAHKFLASQTPIWPRLSWKWFIGTFRQ